ncbi:DUF4191 domain-containing protein [Cryobacterium sp. TMT1-21]|uniref:DUF4191 domain-containing protein n=1 Tax=Cryobacterium shii TaxID=1259235 RepID=A0AAQ2HH88_9MICO|nr:MULTISPECIES: DUF4191 domain-containing protein [Cryobacterium]TFC52593.1 DUF4191 domain-containing protein [Cryobacterium shii]TFC82374.1 DUF4191 domain-containing protein [Cryobacterium sp. TmT2-59]TFD16376.1 DUF4191 domain-containing protein [Cryobacterium sp. TMT1-21]TFD17689.1 DUF4191 domain-containing protein [Cryobacterium sp. TMT4-10]TFD27966.1 DUF4191 domain-containing protein [Cryobacterium sp. TMT2-23]
MARSKDKTPKPPKQPGRLKQMWQVFQMTRRYDSKIVLLMIASFVIPVAISLVLGFLLSPGNVLTIILWVIAGILAGVLAMLIILGRRAEKAAYSQIEGQPGAVGAVLRSSLKRGWVGSEMPVAVNGKTQDAVYRAVGRGGVVLISEGPRTRTARMLEEERRMVTRLGGSIAVTVISVGPDADAVPLHKLARRLTKIKPTLTKAEVLAVNNRLTSMTKKLPIPKGVDPMKARPQRGN